MIKSLRWWLLPCSFGLLSLATATPAIGILNIIPIFNAGQSEAPSFDPAGSGLMDLMDQVEAFYQDVFEDDHTLTINFWYEDLPGGRIGQHSLVDQGPSCNNLLAPTPDCRELEANVRIDTLLGTGGAERNWFIDPTPAQDNEFNMQQTLWRDVSVSNRDDWFLYGANIPDTFEVGYSGNAIDAGSDAGLGTDMLSTLFHEVGHALGMSASNSSTVAETIDGDYDFNPDFIFNRTLAAEDRDSANDFIGHLDNSLAGMNGFNLGGPGARVLPSHTDLFAMAAGSSFLDLDVPRREFYGGNDWHTDGNWSGNTIPGAFDMAFVRDDASVSLSGNATVRELVVDEESSLSVNVHRLTVLDTLRVQNTTGSGTTALTVAAVGELFAEELLIGSDSLVLSFGLIDVDNLTIDAGGELLGSGNVDVSNVIGDFTNDGRIAAVFGGTLTIESDSLLDLDGLSGDGELRAVDGNLVFDASLTDAFNGEATVGAGRTMSFNSGFSVGAGGLLLLDGEPTNAATVAGIVSVGSSGVLRGDGRSVVSAMLIVNNNGIVETNDAATQLGLNGFTSFAGGRIFGTGTVLQTGDAEVVVDTTISVATYDMDGQFGDSTIDVESGVTLRIESASIESTGGGDGYDGTLNINRGTVDIVASWLLEGTVNFSDTGSGFPTLTGDGGVTVQNGTMNFLSGGTAQVDTSVFVNSGTIFVDNDTTWNGPTVLGVNTAAEINNADDSWRLRGETTLIGPTIVGNGRLILEDQVNIAFADTSIGTAETDLDGTLGTTEITINNGLTFSISSITIEPVANDGFDGTINNYGTFSVLAGWRLDGTLNMDPTSGNTATLGGLGSFEIFNTGIVNAREDVVVQPNTTIGGTLNVTAGRTQMNGSATFESTANVDITSTGELELNGPTSFSGGSYEGDGVFQWNGSVNVSAVTSMNLGIVDMDGAVGSTIITASNRLTLNVDQVDLVGNRFDGTMNFNGLFAGLEVNLNDPNASWQMDGVINANGSGLLAQNVLRGSNVNVTGTINADALTQTMAVLDISGALTTVDSATEFRFSSGPHIIRNTAVVNGLGTMVVNSNGTVLAEDGSTIGIDVINRGRFEPGTSIGTATVTPNFTQERTGTFAVELAGAPGVDHDLLQVGRTATLDGEIEIASIDDFVPTPGEVFTLLTAIQVLGTFDSKTTLSDSVVQFDGVLGYPGSRVTFQVTEVSLLGDFNEDLILDCADIDALVAEIAGGGMSSDFDLNGDGVIDLTDMDLWLEGSGNFNVGGPYLPGDANLDGFVSVDDFDVWNADKFTNGAGWCGADFNADGVSDISDLHIWNEYKSMASAPVAVPEPESGMAGLAALVLLAMAASRMRRRAS